MVTRRAGCELRPQAAAVPRHERQHPRVTIFEGGHEIVHQAALNWLAKQRKGQPPVWEVKDFIPISSESSASGK
jgi:hypothetical protein